MSGFFGASGSGSAGNTNGSATGGSTGGTSGGGGGWGSFLKQGLSSIESKLDMVLDMQVPMTGGASGTLTSFSGHSIVLPASVTGAQAITQSLSNSQGDVADTQGKVSEDSTKSLAPTMRASQASLSNKSSAQDLRRAASTQKGMQPTTSEATKDDSSVSVDPFTGLVTATPSIKRMSTPPVPSSSTSGAESSSPTPISAAAAAAAANRERLEQRMRGIFKKPTESPPTSASTPPVSAIVSPTPSLRKKLDVDVKTVAQDTLPPKPSDESLEEIKEAEDRTISDAVKATSEDQSLLALTTKKSEDDSDISIPKTTPLKDDGQPGSVEQTLEASENMAKVPQVAAEEGESTLTKEESDNDEVREEQEEDEAEALVTSLDQESTTKETEKEPQQLEEEKPEELEQTMTDVPVDVSSRTSIETSTASTPNRLASRPYTPESDRAASPSLTATSILSSPGALRKDVGPPVISTVIEAIMDSKASAVSTKGDDNPLQKVLEQREEQLFKVMQEQSNLLERLRDLEDAKAAQDSVQAVKIAGLQKIVDSQKKELELARGSSLSSQPKSVQKTLEEQRSLLEEKDEQIRGLLEEGEILSKKEFKHLTSIKTLRMKNIEFEKLQLELQKKFDKTVAELTDAQSKGSIATEENKILHETIKSLNEAHQRQTKQMSKMESELVQLREDKAGLQMGLDRAWQELTEARKASAELSSQTHAAALEREMKMNEDLHDEMDQAKAQHAAIEASLRQDIQDLRTSLSNREETAGEKEDQLWMEIRSLQARLEQTDNDSFELQEALDEARRPLLRQMEVLQNQHQIANRNWEKVEKSLTRRLHEAEEDVVKAQERERAARDKLDELKSQKSALEARLETLRIADTQLRSEANMAKRACMEKEEATRQAQAELSRERIDRERAIEEAKEDVERKWRQLQQSEVEKLKAQIQQLQKQRASGPEDDFLSAEATSAAAAATRRPSSSNTPSSPMMSGGPLMMGQTSAGASATQRNGNTRTSFDSITSPTGLDGMPPSLSRSSSSQTMTGMMGGGVSTAGLMSMGTNTAGPAVAIERLNTMVRQLEGQVTFLSEQVRSTNKNKDELSNELVRVTIELEELQKVASRVPGLEQELKLLQERHRAALEMLGERTEEVQELRADIVDVKEAYRDQISELLSQLEKSRKK